MAYRFTEAWLRLVYKRQTRPPWDATYIPGILATRAEAPDLPHASIITPSKLSREVHLLSTGERAAALLGLYHPDVVGLQEQRWIPGHTTEHPLATFPGVQQVGLPPLPGLNDLVERLDLRRYLTTLAVGNPDDDTGGAMSVTAPWFGDLLWAVRDKAGIFCVNWNVKNAPGDHNRRIPRVGKRRDADAEKAVARCTAERTRYASAGIATHLIASQTIDSELTANLHQLFLHHRRNLDLSQAQRTALREHFTSALELGVPPYEVVIGFLRRHNVERLHPVSYLYQLIWGRHLRVDLFSPIHVDRPLRPMQRDPITVYANWFARGGQK